MIDPKAPIGLFDSGVGGLTVAKAIRSLLPNENMIYYGDTAHLPYGDKSRDAIICYSLSIARFLLNKQCKVILIACNSASSNAFEEVKESVGNKAVVLNVIDPVIDYVTKDSQVKNIGVIGTKATISSASYEDGIKLQMPGATVSSLATPLFVPMIEEGFVFDDISNAIIRSYLARQELSDIDSLILGCTHYPIIKDQINRFFDFNVKIIDSSMIIAQRLQGILKENNLLCKTGSDGHEFYVSDYTLSFERISRMFFDEKIDLIKQSLH